MLSLLSVLFQVNIIPALAEAYVNLRIHSAQSLQEVASEMLFCLSVLEKL